LSARQRLFGICWLAGRRRPGAEVEGVGFVGDDHDRRKAHSLSAARPLEQVLNDRPEAPVAADGCLDNWCSPATGRPQARSCDVNLAIDSKLRGCDLVRLRVDDVFAGGRVRDRATVIQKKTGRPVQFEITEQARSAIDEWLAASDTRRGRYLFPSRFRQQPHLSAQQYARIVHRWAERAGLDSSAYGTHSLRRTKAAQIYRKTDNLRAVQLLLGHTKLESTVRYLGIEVDDALTISEQVEL
jgi:integrase